MPLARGGLCRVTPQPNSPGVWTIYMKNYVDRTVNMQRSPSAMSGTSMGDLSQRERNEPEKVTLQLSKSSNGMGLSIVAAKGVGQKQLGIFIKSVVKGGSADID